MLFTSCFYDFKVRELFGDDQYIYPIYNSKGWTPSYGLGFCFDRYSVELLLTKFTSYMDFSDEFIQGLPLESGLYTLGVVLPRDILLNNFEFSFGYKF